jgi:hypothetical protein
MMASSRAIAASLAILAGAMTATSLAHAAPTAGEKETARGLMTEGRAARARGDKQAAMKAFAGADALMHVPTTGLELAKAQAEAGMLVEARDTALRVTRMPEETGEPAPFRKARRDASALEADLATRIPSIRVKVTNLPEGVRPKVEVDGTETPAELLEQPIRVNPGHHAVSAQAGTAKGEQEVDITEKESRDVSLELPPQEKPAPPPPEVSSSRPEPSEPEEKPTEAAPSSASHGTPALVVTGFSVAGTGAITGLVTGLVSMSKTSAVKNSGLCQNGGTLCSPSEDGDIRSARTTAMVSNVSFAVAGAGAVVGVIGLFVGGGSTPSAQTTARVEPWVGLGALGLRGSF